MSAAEPAQTHAAADDAPRTRVATWIGAVVVTLALSAGLATFLILSGSTPIVPIHQVVVGLFAVNAIIILTLLGLVVFQAFLLFRARWRGAAGSSLHVRIVRLFSLVAAAPAILLAVIAMITLDKGLEPWFSQRMRDVIFKSVEVADAFTRAQCTTMARESRLLVDDLARVRSVFDTNRELVETFVTARATALGLPVVKLIRADGQVLLRARLNVIADPENPPEDAFNDARSTGDPICAGAPGQPVMSMLLRVNEYDQAFLLIARQVDPVTVDFPLQARAAAQEYLLIDSRRQGVQLAFGAMYLLITLTVLLSAVWFGLSFSSRLISPIRRLIGAADQVAGGNLQVQVPVKRSDGDIGHLGESFNKMTADLRRQRESLVTASDVLDKRRRFIETVLGGVSAGVVGLDDEDRITLMNRSAEMLLGLHRRGVGAKLAELTPELSGVLSEARAARQRSVGAQVVMTRGGRERTLNVRVSREGDGPSLGLVVTIDDITDLVSAQRTSAWADVARRIAHEIKNPLTPIQLSAERIRRKFGKAIVEDREILDQCTDTIIRQVDDIRRMVDEFSSFARMPKPQPVMDDLAGMVREVVFMMRVGNPDIGVEAQGADEPVMTVFDRRLLSQALTNVVKNGAEAIHAVQAQEPGAAPGRVEVILGPADGGWSIEVMDTGKGFPADNRQRLLEPYMTTREGGTGLGLAIVGKILEEHGGRIELLDRPDGLRGANVRFWLPLDGSETEPGNAAGSAKESVAREAEKA
jgi:two-component system, NtrC family, nitrogen regulation sensor histidine kinase NtrY